MSILRTFLGEAAIRLQRALGVDASVSPRFETEERLVPTVLLADATLPGFGDKQGRRFAGGTNIAAGAGAGVLIFEARQDLLIEEIQFSTQIAGEMRIQYIPPSTAVALAIATDFAYFLDRAVGQEAAPIQQGSDATGGTGIIGSTVWRHTNVVNTVIRVQVTPFLLMQGARIQTRLAVVGTYQISIYGRTFG